MASHILWGGKLINSLSLQSEREKYMLGDKSMKMRYDIHAGSTRVIHTNMAVKGTIASSVDGYSQPIAQHLVNIYSLVWNSRRVTIKIQHVPWSQFDVDHGIVTPASMVVQGALASTIHGQHA